MSTIALACLQGAPNPGREAFFGLHENVLKQNWAYPSFIRQGMANMQFIMNLIWKLSRGSSIAALSQGRRR